jgi:hypothetical protein
MFVVKREELYRLNWFGREIQHRETHEKRFLDGDFIRILDFISDKGLDICIPTKLDGWDATFVYRKLKEPGHRLGRSAEELALFLYMRLERRNPVWVEYKGLFRAL